MLVETDHDFAQDKVASTSPWASVIAQNAQGDVQVLASFVTEAGGLRYHVEQQVTPWLRNHARFIF